ncbi:hypothetical protein [Bifidobacterium leontopitheci]|uniref:hypothetical protein n=1 Tax=Bifidobacterium leontopitheci TaxID=2650774 RepID=UPI0012645DF5|nr:hypothetical protein [Bifidobacterium leontopitheci]
MVLDTSMLLSPPSMHPSNDFWSLAMHVLSAALAGATATVETTIAMTAMTAAAAPLNPLLRISLVLLLYFSEHPTTYPIT